MTLLKEKVQTFLKKLDNVSSDSKLKEGDHTMLGADRPWGKLKIDSRVFFFESWWLICQEMVNLVKDEYTIGFGDKVDIRVAERNDSQKLMTINREVFDPFLIFLI